MPERDKPMIENAKARTDMPDMADWDREDFEEEIKLLRLEIGAIDQQIEAMKAETETFVDAWGVCKTRLPSEEDREWHYRAKAAKKHLQRRLVAVTTESKRRYPSAQEVEAKALEARVEVLAAEKAEVLARELAPAIAAKLGQKKLDEQLAISKRFWKAILALDVGPMTGEPPLFVALFYAYGLLENFAQVDAIPREHWDKFMYVSRVTREVWREDLIRKLEAAGLSTQPATTP